ncbi:MAG: VWA domain-containing protein [Terriglobales bacterium]
MPILTSSRAPAVVSCLLVFAIGAWAQSPTAAIGSMLPHESAGLPGPAPALPAAETFRTRVDEVNVIFTVSNTSGKYTNQLSLDDLTVLDDQRAPERISYFQRQSDLPLRVGILVDLSNSITQRFAYEKSAAAMFLEKVLRPQLDEAFIVGFASSVVLDQDFTGDIGVLSKAIKQLRAGGDTRLYDAICFAADKLAKAPGPATARRAIILITDGEDTRSEALIQDAIHAALRSETTIFVLSSNDISGQQYPRGEAVLELISRPTGGGVLPAHSKPQIANAFNRVKEALHSQYAIGYKPAGFKLDGAFRRIEIVPHSKKLRVHCRRGYFAPRETQESTVHATGP